MYNQLKIYNLSKKKNKLGFVIAFLKDLYLYC
jgi:hypothetical protein